MSLSIYLITAVVILVMDFAWLTLNGASYNRMVQAIQRKPIKLNMTAAILAYAAVLASIYLVAVPLAQQAIAKRKSTDLFVPSLIYGGGVGFFIYAIYNLTNLATLENYSWTVALCDTLWGTTLYTLSTWLFLILSSKQ